VSVFYFILTFEDTADAAEVGYRLKQNSTSEGNTFLSITVRRVPVTPPHAREMHRSTIAAI